MKILFAIKALNNEKGGAERVMVDMSSALAEMGHQVSALSFDDREGKSFYPFSPKVHRIPLKIGDVSRKATIGELISRMVAIRKTANKIKPDIIVAFMHSTFIPASFAMIGTGVPIIASEHIVPDHYKSRRWEYILLFLSRFFVTKITVLSDVIIKSYPVFMRSKMVAMPNPVKPATSYATLDKAPNERKIILNVGRLTHQKDQKILIQAFAKIADQYPLWDVRIMGDGELREALINLVGELDLKERVFLPGTTKEIEKEYQQADIFALSSKYESFGLVTAEAMAHGLPTIGFRSCPGTNELIEHEKNGLLVGGNEEGTEEEKIQFFAEGLSRLIEDHDLCVKLGQEGIKTAASFNSQAIAEKWKTLLEDVLKD